MSPSPRRIGAFLAAALAAFPGAAQDSPPPLPSLDGASLKVQAESQPTSDIAAAAQPSEGLVEPGSSVDLGSQFPQGREDELRSQGQIGDCHDFAAVALLEAGIKRQYGFVRLLSPTDLFINLTIADNKANVSSTRAQTGTPEITEGGGWMRDMNFALQNGVAAFRDMPYATFYRLYTDMYKNIISNDVEKEKSPTSFQRPAAAPASPGMPPGTAGPEADPQAPQSIAVDETPQDGAFTRDLDLILKDAKEDYPKARASREQTRKLLQGFSIGLDKLFPADCSGNFGSCRYERDLAVYTEPDRCRALGVAQGTAILNELKAGRPVGVGIDLKGILMAPANEGRQGHALIIMGYDFGKDGRLMFKTVNSWGKSRDYLIFDSDLCRIAEVVSLRVPNDR